MRGHIHVFAYVKLLAGPPFPRILKNKQMKRSQKGVNFPLFKNGSFPNEEKVILFRLILGETFTDTGHSTDFKTAIYNYEQEFVSDSDDNFSTRVKKIDNLNF